MIVSNTTTLHYMTCLKGIGQHAENVGMPELAVEANELYARGCSLNEFIALMEKHGVFTKTERVADGAKCDLTISDLKPWQA